MTLPAQSQSLLNMPVSQMMTEDTRVTVDGRVLGTLLYLEKFTGYSSAAKEQQGHYFALKLTKTGQKMTIKKNGTAAKNKTDMTFDPEIVLRVEDNDTVFEIEVDKKSVVKLNFKETVLTEKEE